VDMGITGLDILRESQLEDPELNVRTLMVRRSNSSGSRSSSSSSSNGGVVVV